MSPCSDAVYNMSFFMRCYKPLMHLKGSELNLSFMATRAHDAIALLMPSVHTKHTAKLSIPAHPTLVSCNHTVCQKSTTLPPVPGFAHIFLLLAVQRHLRRWQPEPEGSLRGFGHEARPGPLLRPGVTATDLAAVQGRPLPLHVDHRGMVTGRKGISTDRKQNVLLDVKRTNAHTKKNPSTS